MTVTAEHPPGPGRHRNCSDSRQAVQLACGFQESRGQLPCLRSCELHLHVDAFVDGRQIDV